MATTEGVTRGPSRAVLAVIAVAAVLFAALVAPGGRVGSAGAASPAVSAALDAVACPTADQCIAVGGAGGVLVSSNAGARWAAVKVPTRHYLYGVACADPSQCVAVGDAGTVVVWHARNNRWTAVHSGTSEPLSSVTCVSAGPAGPAGWCYAVGDGGAELVSHDGGVHWQDGSLGPTIVATGVACASDTDCVAVTSNAEQIFRTTDGNVWSLAGVQGSPLLALVALNGVSCAGATCVAGGADGEMAYSPAAGATWSFGGGAANAPMRNGIACPTASQCIAVGDAGSISTTDDGGAQWVSQSPPTPQTLLGATCTAPSSCVAVGSGATILTTSDGGQHWVVRHGALAARTPRVRVLVVGDSLAHTLALYVGRNAAAYGVTFIDGGLDGCALARGDILGYPGMAQGQILAGQGSCRATGPGWPDMYSKDIFFDRPQVALVVQGPWDLSTRQLDGKWVAPGQPAYDAYYEAQLATAVRILASAGAHVVIATVPATRVKGRLVCKPGTARRAQPTNCPSMVQRVAALHAAAAAVAARHPTHVTVVDLGGRLEADQRFTRTVDGVVVRAADGVHLSEPGGEWLQPWLLSTLTAAAPAPLHKR